MDYESWQHMCQCPVCDSPASNPRILPCFHSACTNCLNLHITRHTESNTSGDDVTSFPCPECSTDIPVPVNTDDDDDDDGCDDGVFEGDGGGGSKHKSIARRFKSDLFVNRLSDVLHALVPDKVCDTCSKMGETKPGTDWCVQCVDVLCSQCAKNHLYGKATSDHSTLPLAQLSTLTLNDVINKDATHACFKHPLDVVKLYCLDCRTPVCVQCLSERHRQCENCLPLKACLDREEDGVAQMMVTLNSMTLDPDDDLESSETGAGILENSVMKAQDTIRKIAADARKKIDESEQELLSRLYSVTSQLQEKVGDFRQNVSSKRSDLQSLSFASSRMDALLKYGSHLDVLDLFTSMKTLMAKVERSPSHPPSSGDVSINSTGDGDDDIRIKVVFEMSPSVKSFLQEFESLGDIAIEDFKSDDGMSSWGVCVTSSDVIIVVDCRARKVQKFGISGDLLDHIQMNDDPCDVTACCDDEVAIPVMKKQILILEVASSMSLKRRIKTHKQYTAISASPSSPDVFLVSSLEDRCVDVISFQGDLLKSFGALQDGSSVFESPRYVTQTVDGKYIVSDSTKNTVTCISDSGALAFSYDPPGPHKIKSAQGLCCDTNGNLFVADFGNSRVHLLTSGGEFQRFVLGRDSGLSRPVAMALSQGNKLVIVQADGMVKIFGYESMKVKFKGTCWCPRCLASMETKEKEGSQGRPSAGSVGSDRSSRSSVTSSVTSPITRTPPRSPVVKSPNSRTPSGAGYKVYQ